MNFDLWPETFASSLSLAALYIVLGLSWVVVFRTTKVLNFAVGEFAVIGGYFLFALRTGLPWLVTVLIALLLAGCVGGATYAVALKPLAGRPHWTPAIVTMGVALMLDSIISIKWSSASVFLTAPFGNHVYSFHGALLGTRDLVAIVGAVVALVLVLALLRYTRLGSRMRAAAEHPLLASQSGIRINRLFVVGWGMSAMVAALGGITYAIGTSLTPDAVSIGILGLAPALLGGLDSVGGVLIGGIVAALAVNFTVLYIGSGASDMVSALLVLVVLLIKPTGIFGTKDILRV
jgi:branched-chain amino acid transport system permease protein